MKWGEVIVGVALGALVSLPASWSAHAADMTPVVKGPPATSTYIPAQFWWTGFYMGAGVGYGWGTTAFVDPITPSVSASSSINGFLVSGVAGMNYQFSSVVAGVEGDFTGAFVKGTVTDSAANALTTNVVWTASITGRLGWAIDRLLIYGKGGVGFDLDRATVAIGGGTTTVGSINRVGWTVGGGVEYAVTEHWTGRIEYDYFTFPTKAVPPATNPNGNVGIKLNEIKAIMAYKF